MNITDQARPPPSPDISGRKGMSERVKSLFRDLDSGPAQLISLVTGIDKSQWATSDPDPVEKILDAAVLEAPSEFWSAFDTIDYRPAVARIRNWLLAMIRAKRKEQTGPGLAFLDKLPMNGEMVAQIKLQPVLRVLRKTQNGALTLAQKYGLDLEEPHEQAVQKALKRDFSDVESPTKINTEVKVARHRSDTPKNHSHSDDQSPTKKLVKSELAIPKRQNRVQQVPAPQMRVSFSSLLQSSKRKRDDALETDKETLVPSAPAPTKKHRSAMKKVHWKEDHKLVKVRFFDSENAPVYLMPENTAPLEDGLRSHSSYFEPMPFEINIEPSMRLQMGIKRGGCLRPVAPPDQAGMPLMLASSPAEPTEHVEPRPSRAIPPFKDPGPAKPQDLQLFLTSYARGI